MGPHEDEWEQQWRPTLEDGSFAVPDPLARLQARQLNMGLLQPAMTPSPKEAEAAAAVPIGCSGRHFGTVAALGAGKLRIRLPQKVGRGQILFKWARLGLWGLTPSSCVHQECILEKEHITHSLCLLLTGNWWASVCQVDCGLSLLIFSRRKTLEELQGSLGSY